MSSYKVIVLINQKGGVSRTCRKLQSEFPELVGSHRVQRRRLVQEQVYRQYAKE